MQIGEYLLVNTDKVERAIKGSIGKGGVLVGGVGEKASDADKLAEYDRLGGLIRLDGRQVKTGSFYDFKKQMPLAKPNVVLILKDLEGNTVELGADEALSPELVAAERIAAKKKAKQLADVEENDAKKAEVTAAKKKKKAVTEDEA